MNEARLMKEQKSAQALESDVSASELNLEVSVQNVQQESRAE
jgi:hypothetical protein